MLQTVHRQELFFFNNSISLLDSIIPFTKDSRIIKKKKGKKKRKNEGKWGKKDTASHQRFKKYFPNTFRYFVKSSKKPTEC